MTSSTVNGDEVFDGSYASGDYHSSLARSEESCRIGLLYHTTFDHRLRPYAARMSRITSKCDDCAHHIYSG